MQILGDKIKDTVYKIHLAQVGLVHPLSKWYQPEKENCKSQPIVDKPTGRTGIFGKASATISAVSIALKVSQMSFNMFDDH